MVLHAEVRSPRQCKYLIIRKRVQPQTATKAFATVTTPVGGDTQTIHLLFCRSHRFPPPGFQASERRQVDPQRLDPLVEGAGR